MGLEEGVAINQLEKEIQVIPGGRMVLVKHKHVKSRVRNRKNRFWDNTTMNRNRGNVKYQS